ncbi:MAG: hypothetical protein ABI550_04335 [Ignavibacteriaceae bacterium]
MVDKAALKECKRILEIGSCGTGKSTFAKFLGQKLNLEIIHLDKLYWMPNWVIRNNDEMKEMLSKAVLKDNWIMDGNGSKTLYIRAPRADLIFFFDYAPYFCVFRILKRNLKTKLGLEVRTDLTEGCPEKWFDWGFVKYTWNFKKNYIPPTYKALEELNFNKNKLLIFKNHREFKKYLQNLGELS